MEKQIYCTLFDSNYLSRGLACYESLKERVGSFTLYVFAFDELCYRILKELNLKDLVVVSLREFETEALLRIKNTRTAGEYCWTCTPATIQHVFKHFNEDHCIYIDSDLYFYSDPVGLLNLAKKHPAMITPHNYTPKYDQTVKSGVYCVQYMYFQNTTDGRTILDWWSDRCVEWCYARVEDGKFGDQKYLDDWTIRFPKVFVSPNAGEGLAPWNIQKWSKSLRKQIIFYHFHSIRLCRLFGHTSYYRFPFWTHQFLYRPYLQHLYRIDQQLLSHFKDYKSSFDQKTWFPKMKDFIKDIFLFRFQYFFFFPKKSKRQLGAT